MLIEFNVNNQKLERITKDLFLADQSNNIIQCRFLFNGDDWIGKQRFVLLHNYQCQTYQLHLDETNTIIIPYDIVIKEKFSISLYGEDETEERITTNVVTLRLDPSGFTTEIEDIVDIDPDIWTQIWNAIDGKSNIGHVHVVADITDFPVLANVATSGYYSDLKNKPTIPTNISDLVNDSDFISRNNTAGLVKNDGTIDTTQYLSEHQDISGKVNYTDIVDNLTTNDSEKPLSAKQGKAIADMIGNIQLYVNR